MRLNKGDKVTANVGRAKGMICTVVRVTTEQVPDPSGGLCDRVTYDIRTSNGNILRRAADKVAPAKNKR